MPRKRRPVRTVRRPTFRPAPEPSEAPDGLEAGEPSFADEPPVTVPAYGAGGPVETRPHWVSRNERVQGRRLAQLRRSSGETRGVLRTGTTGMLPLIATGPVRQEIRQIMITTGIMVAILVALTFIMR